MEYQMECSGATAVAASEAVLAIGFKNGTIMLYDSKNFALIESLAGHYGEVTCLCFNEEENVMASGSEDSNVVLWDL